MLAPRAVWLRPLSVDKRPSLMTYAAVPQMHRTGKKSPAEAGPRAFAEAGSLDFRNGTIPERGDWFHQEKPRTPGAFFNSASWCLRRQLVRQLGPLAFNHASHFVRDVVDMLDIEHVVALPKKNPAAGGASKWRTIVSPRRTIVGRWTIVSLRRTIVGRWTIVSPRRTIVSRGRTIVSRGLSVEPRAWCAAKAVL